MEKAREEIKNSKVDIREEMRKAKDEIKEEKATLKGYREMLDDMEKKGLINTKEDYSIEYKGGDLFINDKKQSQEITDKYKNYFKKDNTSLIKKSGELEISND